MDKTLLTLKQSLLNTANAMVAQILDRDRSCTMFVSSPGIGKSSVLYNDLPRVAAQVFNLYFDDIAKVVDVGARTKFTSDDFYIDPFQCPAYEGCEAKGLQVPMRSDGDVWTQQARTRLSRPTTTALFPVTFLDEFDKAGGDLKNALSEYINDGQLGDSRVGLNHFIVGASNRSIDRSGSTKMPAHIQNRICELHIRIDFKALSAFLMGQDMPTLALAYMNSKKAELFSDTVPDKAQPYCTPRSFHKAFKILQRLDKSNPEPVQRRALLAGLLGESVATDYLAYEKYAEELTPWETLTADPKHAPIPENLGLQYAQAMMVWGELRHDDSKIDEAFRYVTRMPRQFQTMLLEHAFLANPKFFDTDSYMDFISNEDNMQFVADVTAYSL